MVMLAKGLALHPNVRTPRVIIVTDRINLDDQIWTTFRHCGKRVVKATSGRDLADLIRRKTDAAITTIIDKFDTVAKAAIRDDDADVFLLVDESHRSQYGVSHARMRQVFPNACLIGFTGTPLLKKEKSTAARFGGFIHTYSMRQAVEDQAVVPLLYEGRMAEMDVDQADIDTWFDRVTRELADEQKLDLKRKFSRSEQISRVDQRIQQIAYDIGEHYANHVRSARADGNAQPKAMLATSSKQMALKYKLALDEWGMVTTEVVISAPDTREGHTTVDGPAPEEEAFWKRMMDRFGNEEVYNREITAGFSREGGVEMLIVVDKLLVGFDEPRATVLYLDKPLREHALLQAIARVNRLFDGKDFGYIVDYRGVLGELNAAMESYDMLAGYDPEDLDGAFTDISEEMARLPQRHSAVWTIFDPVPNKRDTEALQRFLAPEDVRRRFYDALSLYAKTLKVALSAARFYEETPADKIAGYRSDLRFFHSLRTAVAFRYAETVQYKDYDRRIETLLDRHVRSGSVTQVVREVNIFDVSAFQAELDKLGTPAAKADAIAHHAKRTLNEMMERDPAFYAKFSRMIQETIDAYRQGRITDAEFLKRAESAQDQILRGYDDDTPARLRPYRDAAAYYGLLTDPLGEYELGSSQEETCELLSDIAIELQSIIDRRKVVDWTNNADVKQDMRAEMDDLIYIRTRDLGAEIPDGVMDYIIDGLLDVAKARDLAS